MTEAQKCLYHIAENMRMDKSISKEGYEYFQQAIKALEQEPCEDCVSREQLNKLYNEYRPSLATRVCEFGEKLKELPSVTPQPKTGHWITEIKSDLRGDMWPTNPKCSECGGEPYFSKTIYSYNFCPYCGAKMERSDKE